MLSIAAMKLARLLPFSRVREDGRQRKEKSAVPRLLFQHPGRRTVPGLQALRSSLFESSKPLSPRGVVGSVLVMNKHALASPTYAVRRDRGSGGGLGKNPQRPLLSRQDPRGRSGTEWWQYLLCCGTRSRTRGRDLGKDKGQGARLLEYASPDGAALRGPEFP